jgi:hypothetical protein
VREGDEKKVPFHQLRRNKGPEPGCHSDHLNEGPNLLRQKLFEAGGKGWNQDIYDLIGEWII